MWMPLLILHGCHLFDPERTAAVEYITAVQPLMAENSMLAQRTLVVAAGIQNGDLDDEGVLEAWSTEVVPLAQHLHFQAGEVTPPEQWVDLHEELTTIWLDRSVAYRDLGEAIVLADDATWDRAKAQHETTIEREQAWFQSVGARLQVMELSLEQYP